MQPTTEIQAFEVIKEPPSKSNKELFKKFKVIKSQLTTLLAWARKARKSIRADEVKPSWDELQKTVTTCLKVCEDALPQAKQAYAFRDYLQDINSKMNNVAKS